MSDAMTVTSSSVKKKKSIMKRWWFWLLSLIVLVVAVSVATQGDSTVYELSQMVKMNKQQMIEKFGKPDEVVRDDQDGYSYAYNGGFTVSGNDSVAQNIVLSSAFVKGKSSDAYKIFDVQLNSSFQEHVQRLGKPQIHLKKDDKNLVAYIVEDKYLLTFSSKFNEDKVNAIEMSEYDVSTLAMALDISSMLNKQASEDELQQIFTIKDKSTESKITTYYLDGFSMVLNKADQTVAEIIINSKSIFNIMGLRTSQSLDKAVQLFGEPVQKAAGVKDTTQYIFNVDHAGQKNKLHVTADNTSKQIQYIGLSLK